jgi:hypothetical protein
MYMTPCGETPGTDRPAATFEGQRQFGPDHLPEVFMRRTRSMLVSAATLVLLGTLPTVAQAQAKDAMSKDAMQDKDAMMGKDADAMQQQGAAKGKPAMKEKDGMAEPSKMK